jgi:hypothetical protein
VGAMATTISHPLESSGPEAESRSLTKGLKLMVARLAITPLMEVGKVFLPSGAEWLDEHIDELADVELPVDR